MKFVILLCVLSALLLQIDASPVQLLSRSERAVARQQAVNNDVAPAAAASSDDDDEDDEDDDDDEPDLGDLVDDDDGRWQRVQSVRLQITAHARTQAHLAQSITRSHDNSINRSIDQSINQSCCTRNPIAPAITNSNCKRGT